MRDLGAQLFKLCRVLEKFDDFLKLLFFLVRARHIGKGDALFLVAGHFDARAPEAVQLAALAVHLPDHIDPERDEDDHHDEVGQEGGPPVDHHGLIIVFFDRAVGVLCLDGLLGIVDEKREIAQRVGDGLILGAVGLPQLHRQPVVGVNAERLDFAFFKITHNVAVGQRLGLLCGEEARHQPCDRQDKDDVHEDDFHVVFHSGTKPFWVEILRALRDDYFA